MTDSPFQKLAHLRLCDKCRGKVADPKTGLCRKCEIERLEKQQAKEASE